jgi:hypothetical protein
MTLPNAHNEKYLKRRPFILSKIVKNFKKTKNKILRFSTILSQKTPTF